MIQKLGKSIFHNLSTRRARQSARAQAPVICPQSFWLFIQNFHSQRRLPLRPYDMSLRAWHRLCSLPRPCLLPLLFTSRLVADSRRVRLLPRQSSQCLPSLGSVMTHRIVSLTGRFQIDYSLPTSFVLERLDRPADARLWDNASTWRWCMGQIFILDTSKNSRFV